MAPADLGNVPAYWIRPTHVLSAAPGFHRFVWDLHYAPPAGTSSQPDSIPSRRRRTTRRANRAVRGRCPDNTPLG